MTLKITDLDIAAALKAKLINEKEIREKRPSSQGVPSLFCPMAQAAKRVFNTTKVRCGRRFLDIDDKTYQVTEEMLNKVIQPFDAGYGELIPCEIELVET